MVIDGVSDELSFDPYHAMVQFGKIKKGAPKNEKGHVGRDQDHFRFVLEPNFDGVVNAITQKTYNQTLIELYGAQPKILDDVRFASNVVNTVFDSWFEEYGGYQQLKTRCTGSTIVKHLPDGEFEHSFAPIPCKKVNGQVCGCKQIGRLMIVLEQFSRETKIFGYWVFETHAFDEIRQMAQTLMKAQQDIKAIDAPRWILERVERKKTYKKRNESGKAIGFGSATRHDVVLRMHETAIGALMDRIESESRHILMSGESVIIPDQPLLSAPLAGGNPPQVGRDAIDLNQFLLHLKKYKADITIEDINSAIENADFDVADFVKIGDRERLIALTACYLAEMDSGKANALADVWCENIRSVDMQAIYVDIDSLTNSE